MYIFSRIIPIFSIEIFLLARKVSKRERDRERERARERQRETERDRETERQRDRETERQREFVGYFVHNRM